MEIQKIEGLLGDICGPGKVTTGAMMQSHTYFKIGGPADLLVTPTSVGEVKAIIDLCRVHEIPYMVIGNGTNLLVSDKGIRGLVIKIAEGFDGCKVEGNTITASAGILLSNLAKVAMNHELGGFEFASGIPGTIGGAIVMNAGAYGGEMKDVVKSVTYIDEDGTLVTLPAEAMAFDYRKSIISGTKRVVLEVVMQFESKPKDEIKAIIDELTEKRTSKQPLELPSAGSTFKRPPNNYAGKLIEDAGLRGLRHGDAQVSEKHCGFVVNRGKATANEVEALIKIVQKTVYDKFDVLLEPEVKIIGER
ncbi:MAG: UDP-N-acetylmuramate dehydrogenase [Clostridia bacterium]|nr:UDP-N-acetylmuramate dehydrogenase [Clostridia bacterium]